MSTRRSAELCDSAPGLSRRHALGRLAGGLAAGAVASLATARAQIPPPALTGRVVRSTDRAYDAARFDFNRRFDVRPLAIVYPKDTGDVGNAVRWARAHGVPLSVRSGGHSYEAFSLGPGLVIDVSAMHAVTLDPPRHTITAQSGVRLLDLYRWLWNEGVAVSGGTCASVGLGGLTVGGGVGYLSRMWGLTADNVIRFEVVDAEGRALEATPGHNPDLFWALRGGGASFGIVTEITVRVQPIGSVVVVHLEWPFEQAAAVLSAWQQHQVSWPDELSFTLELGGTPAGTLAGEAAIERAPIAP